MVGLGIQGSRCWMFPNISRSRFRMWKASASRLSHSPLGGAVLRDPVVMAYSAFRLLGISRKTPVEGWEI